MTAPVVPNTGTTCRHCGQPIHQVYCGRSAVWVHRGPGGAFPCRDRVTGMSLPTQAAPVPEPAETPEPSLAAVTIGAPPGRYDDRRYHGRHRSAA